MNSRKLYFFTALIVTITSLLLLASGSPLLTYGLDKNNAFPLGTLITWAGMACLPLAIYWGIQNLRKPAGLYYKVLAAALKSVIILGVLWMPICFLLAGNFSFSFLEKASFQGGQTAMKLFWVLSFSIPVASIVILMACWVGLLFSKAAKK